MRSAEDLLDEAAKGNLVIGDDWPRVRDFVLQRLDELVATEFPPPPASAQPRKLQIEGSQTQSNTQSQSQSQALSLSAPDKENAPPGSSIPTHPLIARPQPHPSPVEVAQSQLATIRETLSTGFPNHPPHTIQRLSELILYPKREYKYLPSYLQAVYRAVGVSSTTETLPLVNPAYARASPAQTLGLSSPRTLLINGIGSDSGASSSASSHYDPDDTLGGALLTPIPWYRGSESPEPDLSHDQTPLFETAPELAHGSVNGQIEDSVHLNGEVPGASGDADIQASESGPLESESNANQTGDEVPHHRGPEEVGVQDTGPDAGMGGVAGLVAERLGSPTATSHANSTLMEDTDQSPEGKVDEKMDVDTEDIEKK